MEGQERIAEFRFVEIRHNGGRVITGTAVVYGELATMPWGKEVVDAGAFNVEGRDLILNVMHERKVPISRTGAGLVVSDSPARLEFRAEVARTRAGDDALELVRTRILPGASVEFMATEDRFEDDLRRIVRADLYGFGLADRPSYPSSLVEARTAALPGTAKRRRQLWPLL